MTGDGRALAAAVRDAVMAVPGVSRLGTSGPVEVATHYPGGKITGVRVAGPVVEVHVVVDRLPLPPVVRQASSAARMALEVHRDPRPVSIVVTDVLADDFAAADSAAASAAGATDVATGLSGGT